MPNWTNNRITVNGSVETIEKLLSDGKPLREGVYSFASWIPMPEIFQKYDTTNHPNGKGLEVGKPESWEPNSRIVTQELIDEYKKATAEQKEKYGVVGWYDWRVENYGSKWDEEFEPVRVSDDCLVITVDTPWSSPIPFIMELSKRYPDLLFQMSSHFEEGENEVITCQNCDLLNIDDDFVKSPANDYILTKINEREDSEERVLLTKCCQKFFHDGIWKVNIIAPEKQYEYFLACLPYLSESVSGKYLTINEENKLVEYKWN